MLKENNMKITEFLRGLAIILIFFFFAALILVISLSQLDFNQSAPIWMFILIPIFFIIAFEGLLYKMVLVLKMDESKMKDWRTNNIITNLASFFALSRQLRSSIGAILSIVLGVVLLGILAYLGYIMLSPGVTLSTQFFIIIGIYLLYLIFRGYFGKMLSGSVSGMAKFTVPEYTLSSDKVILNIKMKGLKDPSRNFLTFKFRELDDVQVMTGQEVRSFVQYKMGPDVSLQMKESKQMYQYLKGDIPRMNYYFAQGVRSPLHYNVLILRGKEILIIVPIGDKSGDDILKAFKKYKGKI